MVVWLRTPGLRWTNSPGKRRKVVRKLLTQGLFAETDLQFLFKIIKLKILVGKK